MAVGMRLTLMLQLAPTARLVPLQVSSCGTAMLKSPASAPPITAEVIESDEAPRLVRLRSPWPFAPTSTLPMYRNAGSNSSGSTASSNPGSIVAVPLSSPSKGRASPSRSTVTDASGVPVSMSGESARR